MITLEQERATHLYVADKEKVGKVQTRGCGLPDSSIDELLGVKGSPESGHPFSRIMERII